MDRLDLRRIVRVARSGDTLRAWRMFEQAAGSHAEDDYDLLNLRGRLLKDRAVAAQGDDRSRLLAESRDAYLSAARRRRATYPLINAAAIERLAGNFARAREFAAATIALLDQGDHEPDTAYWLAATRAEAALHTGPVETAADLLRDAIALAPDAWEDHASTLRQFRLLLGCVGADDRWLEQLAPPAALHFSGLIHFDPTIGGSGRDLADRLDRLRCGFAYGALAAGADIVIAELLVDRGAELHLVLPARPDIFRRQSVMPFGDHWGERYDRLLARSASVEVVAQGQDVSLAAVEFAAQVAMGSAICQARALEAQAVALRLVDQAAGDAQSSAASDRAWERMGLPLIRVAAPRSSAPVATIPHAEITAIVAAPPARGTTGAAPDIFSRIAPEGHHRAADPAAAARVALDALASAPALRLGLTAGPVIGSDDAARLVELAGLIASAAAPGQLLASRAVGLALLLLAPELRCESDQELSTAYGEMPVWTVAGAGRDA
ncbi:DUF4071 domain-containing protein [Sphingomonas sp. SFZ2018-12]|uniref:tetratricopeptide repeat-containing protein n=1 Tax=Sphingomonas sp. SFZ2018-12 TaxID=2683197 RepID=UPI001F0EFA9B|nr:tetratricopeptide repeat-containing protein [Sphingomonas sp. SFZ2018-12]MCH4892595.1 DUF4071 domain-containing protein [Sphingomonas sp. SFZ2018-12]